ncbi:MAG TPA: DNA cytosine methyltransferase [Candidatus Cybelea sp.]|nr:DNA cytosine methyltransferase [Candidatus Cybelea sp.]
MSRKLLVADLLCGAGGSSTGCARALATLGLDMELVCVNHWPVAIDTHTKNHPKARHYCQDIATVRPHVVVPEGYLDLLMASPSCTHHSVARGGKPTSDQQRSDPWHIITWFTELQVKRAIIENVWEFTSWSPVDPATGKPIKDRKGEYFEAWKDLIWKVGATAIEYRKLNAANYGTAQTRQRFIMKIRFDRIAIGWAPVTHAKRSELTPSGTKPWRPAREIIDWSIKGQSIFARKKPLAEKTLKRIYAGIVKFGWPQPFIVVLRNHMAAQGIDVPLPTIAAGGTHIGLVQPFVLATGSRTAPRSVDDPLPTVTTGGASSARPGCARPMLAEPFMLSRHGGGAPRELSEPTPTQVAKHSHCLIAPYYGSGSGETCNSADDPLPTVTSKARFGMIVPITHSDGSNRARDVESEPLPTLTTAHRGELAFIAAQFGERVGQAPRVHDIDDPAPAICATGHVNLVEGTACYDILFRMLQPHELAAAMGFNRDEARYEFAGTKTEQIKQIGNAVPVEMMEAEVRAFFADETPAQFMEAAE